MKMMKQLTTMPSGLGFGMLVSVLLLLAGCSKEEEANDRLPDGAYPMSFTASVVGQTATRATVGNLWTGGEKVAMQVGSGEVKPYTAASNGLLSSTTPFYWKNTANINVTAWYQHTYSATKPTSFSVQADQSGIGYQQSDLLYAASQQVTFKSSALTFKHLPTKVVVNLKAGDGVMDNDVQSATVSIVNQALTSEVIDTHWAVAQETAGNSVITPNVLPTPTTNYQKSLQAIVVPQQMQNKKFVKVTCGGIEYFYTPTNDTDANLEAGKQHTYNITVKKTGMEVSIGGATAWIGSTTNVASDEVFTADNLKVGDYFYSDGTTSDGGLRRLYSNGTYQMDNIMPDLNGNRTLIGIVLKAGRDSKGDWKDDCSYSLKGTSTLMTTIRGYALALYDAPGGECIWGTYRRDVGTNIERYTGFYGYSNTQKIIASVPSTSYLQDSFIATYNATTNYESQYTAPSTTSGWFLPSAGQGQYWLDHRDILLTNIRKATGNDSYDWCDDYWTSSENNRNGDAAHVFNFDNGNVYPLDRANVFLNVRSVLAF